MTTRKHRINFKKVNRKALRRLPELLANWTVNGRLISGEWVAKNPTRFDRHPGSFKVNIITGKWADFATGDRGGDVISLAAYLADISQVEAARRLADYLGVRHD
jgi:hypothetical protein